MLEPLLEGVDAVALRFFSVYGPRQRPDMAFRRFCEAAAARAPIDIYDRVGGEAYNIGGGSRVSLAGTLELLAAIAGRPLDVRQHERESGDVQDTGADIARAREALGFRPATDLRAGLAAEFESVLEHSRTLRCAVASAG